MEEIGTKTRNHGLDEREMELVKFLMADCKITTNATKLNTFVGVRKLIDDYIYFYNHQRIQLKTELTSIEFRSQFCV